MKGLTEKEDMVAKLQECTEDNDEYAMVWEVKQTIGIKLERTNDWGVVLQKNPGVELPIVGRYICAQYNSTVTNSPSVETFVPVLLYNRTVTNSPFVETFVPVRYYCYNRTVTNSPFVETFVPVLLYNRTVTNSPFVETFVPVLLYNRTVTNYPSVETLVPVLLLQ